MRIPVSRSWSRGPSRRRLRAPPRPATAAVRCFLACLLLTGLLLRVPGAGAAGQTPQRSFAAPEFTQASPEAWINSPPLQMQDLRGKVVLLDFWTFDCWNCYRSFPWLKGLEERLEPEGLQVVGIHTPEFAHERVRGNVIAKTKEFGLRHPVMMDNDFAYWKAMNNRYWPAFYVIDKNGSVRGAFFGETHENDGRALRMEQLIRALLAES